MGFKFKIIRSKDFHDLPAAIRELANRAFHMLKWNKCHADTAYAEAEEMIDACVERLGADAEEDFSVWVLALQVVVDRERLKYAARWPAFELEHDDFIFTQGVEGRMIAAVSLWRLEAAARAIFDGDTTTALNETARAGIALYFSGYSDGIDCQNTNQSFQRKKGPARRLANDKSGKHAVMSAIQTEWKSRKDGGQKFSATAFAKDMAKLHKDAVTAEAIKNAQTKWNKEYHPTR